MSSMAGTNVKVDVLLLISLYWIESCIALLALSLHRLGDRPLFAKTVPGAIALASIVTAFLSIAVVIWRFHKNRALGSRLAYHTSAMNVATVVLMLLAAELSVRTLSRPEGGSAVFLDTQLRPMDWDAVVNRYERIVARNTAAEGYIVPDEYLGWKPGPNRVSSNGLYCTSAEGLRSSRPGVSLIQSNDDQDHLRVALVGDSFTFCEDVSYEESWGYQLGLALGPTYEVLNYGVPGYGVDQAYHRFSSDVLRWNPDVVVFGFIKHDLYRSLTVYPFLAFPDWGYPFSKPRFRFDGNRLRALNQPTLSPEELFSKSSVTDLPYLDYEASFRATDWQFSFYHRSDLVRFIGSRFPPVTETRVSEPSLNEIDLNSEILRMFVQKARTQGAVPILIYFPGTDMVQDAFDSPPREKDAGQIVLGAVARETQVAHADMLDVFQAMRPFPVRAVKHHKLHYSAQANLAVAGQLHEMITAATKRRKP